jgi:hypothetical protein
MRRTTNGGLNWLLIANEYCGAIKFSDENTGWKVFDSVKKTTNGGINWITQKTPNIGNGFIEPLGFSILNKDTVWLAGGIVWNKPPVYKTTNGGANWGFQFPDTTLQISKFDFIDFATPKQGWIAKVTNIIYHTNSGGNDTTYYTGINEEKNTFTSDYILFQNYPNPFNNVSKFKFETVKFKNVKIIVSDILGKEIQVLLDKRLYPGTYEITFNGEHLPSGVYFYSLFAEGKLRETRRMILIK